MTDRPSWMPSRESLLALAHNETLYRNCGDSSAGDELEEVIRDAAIRAQIAVLEEINPHTEQIYNKIAALRKELEG